MANPRDAHIDVVLESEHPTLKFHLESEDIPIGPESHVHFSNCYHPGFHVFFHIKDPHGLGYRFPPNSDKRDAIWSVVGDGACPHSEAWEIFEPLNVSSDRLTLKTKNPNSAEQKFGFTLNVTKTGGPPYEELDPGGTNHNGSYSMSKSKDALLAIGGAVVGSVLTLGANALFK